LLIKLFKRLLKKNQNNFPRPIYGDVTFKTLVQERSPEEKPLPSEGIVYGYISTMIYMCIANVLLLNLLIAMFR
jgi:hypothetical protein